jgi:hypothetical protein
LWFSGPVERVCFIGVLFAPFRTTLFCHKNWRTTIEVSPIRTKLPPERPSRRFVNKEGSDDRDELVVADLDLDEIQEVRTHWQFYRDRRPEMYGPLGGM